jgi:hypothetical protein
MKSYAVCYGGGKRRKGTTYVGLPWAESLAQRRRIAGIALTEKNAIWVYGRARRFVVSSAVPVDPAHALVVVPIAEAWQIPIAPIAGAPKTSPAEPVAMPAPPPVPDLDKLHDALIAVCEVASFSDAQMVYDAAAKANQGEAVPLDVLTGMVDDVGRTRRRVGGKNSTTTPGLVAKMLPARVQTWRKLRATRAREDAKAAAYARDQRINSMARWIQAMDSETIHPIDREEVLRLLAEADPAEVAEARALIAPERAAGGGGA